MLPLRRFERREYVLLTGTGLGVKPAMQLLSAGRKSQQPNAPVLIVFAAIDETF
jgi:hypothetical protein